MNTTPEPDERQTAGRPLSITAEEFDAKFDAGEDISDYIDWDSGVDVMPGELSPGQQRSIQMLETDENSAAFGDTHTEESVSLHVSLPRSSLDQLKREATRRGVTQEELAQVLILQSLDKQMVAS